MKTSFIHVGDQTIAALRGTGEYSVLKEGFAPVLTVINELIDNK